MAATIDASGRTMQARAPRALFRVALPPASASSHRYDVAPDGRILVLEHIPDPAGVPFSVLLNGQNYASRP